MAWGYAGLFPATALDIESSEFQQLAGVRAFIAQDGAVATFAGAAPRASLAGAATGAVVVSDRPGHIIVRTAAPDSQQLSITERFHPGWSATLENGTELPVIALRGDFVACLVPPGSHRIDFRFRPRSFILGSIISGAGIILLTIGAVVVGGHRSRVILARHA